MTTQAAKIRLVRCPKCRLLLPEPEIPVYKCGGCGAILQAKIQKSNTKSTVLNHDGSDGWRGRSLLNERDIHGPNEENHVSARADSSSVSGSNGNQVNGLNQETSSPRGEPALSINSQEYCQNEETTPRGESSSVIASITNQDICPNQETTSPSGEPDVSMVRSENGFHDYNEKLPVGQTLSAELPNSLELVSLHELEMAAENAEKLGQFQCDYNADRKSLDNENESRDSNGNFFSGRSFSEDFYSSVEFLCHETDGSSPERVPNGAGDEINQSLGQLDKLEQTETENCMRELPDQRNFLVDIPSPTVETNVDVDAFIASQGGTFEDEAVDIQHIQHVGSSGGCKSEDHRIAFSIDANSPKEVPLSSEIVPLRQSQRMDANALLNEEIRIQDIENLEKEDTTKKEETGSPDADENPSNGKIIVDNVVSYDNSNMGACQSLNAPAFGQHCMTNSPDNLPLGSSRSVFGPTHKELSKSLTKCYYGHDGSASSYDGFEDRIPNRFAKPPRRKSKHANNKNSHGLPKEDRPRADDSHIGNLEIQYKPTKGPGLNETDRTESEIKYLARKPPTMPEISHPILKYRTKQDDLQDPQSSGHSFGGRMREDKEEHISRVPFVPIYLQTDQTKLNLAPYPLDSIPHFSAIGSSDVPSYAGPNKMDLLRMVYELEEELTRMQILNSRSKEEKYTPTYHDHHLRPVVEMTSDLSFPGYAQRYSYERDLAHLNQPPRMAFSGDAADYIQHFDCACLRCRLQNWRYPIQLPSHAICCNKVHCWGHSNNCYNSPCSTSSSPHHCKSSDFSVWDHDTMSVDQRHRDSGIRNLQLKERYQAKRHVRPVAGGNPIIACYSCSALLQLPADFLLLGRRFHELRCNACGKVLKFALQRGKHIVPSVPEAIAPPPSMVDYSSESIARGNHTSVSHFNADVGPVSFSEDYGASFDRSYSTEADPLPPRHLVQRNSRTRKMSSSDNVMAAEDRKMKSVLGEYQKMSSKSLENFGAVKGEPSSTRSKGQKSSSEIKEISGNGGPPLHRLMGYSSPSAVMKNYVRESDSD